MMCEQHPCFVQRRSRFSRYQRPCSRGVWSASQVGTRPSFSRLGAARLYRTRTVHQSLQPLTRFRFDLSFRLSRVSYVVCTPSSFAPSTRTSVRCCWVSFYVSFFSVCTNPHMPDWYLSMHKKNKLASFDKERKQNPSQGDGAATAEGKIAGSRGTNKTRHVQQKANR